MSKKQIFLPFLLILLTWQSVCAKVTLEQIIDKDLLVCSERVINNIAKNDWQEAIHHADLCNSHNVKKLLIYESILKNETDDFEAINAFTRASKGWPNKGKVQTQLEHAINDDSPSSLVVEYFNNTAPRNTRTFLYLAKQLNNKNSSYYENLIKKAWYASDFGWLERRSFLNKHKDIITKTEIIKKINLLLDRKKISDAKNLFSYIDQDHIKLFSARIKLMKNYSRITALLKTIPEGLEDDDGLLHDISHWLEKRDVEVNIAKYIQRHDARTNPENWADIRTRNVRYLLKQENYQLAYNIASQHNLKGGSSDFANLEWLSGWLALRFLNQPSLAYLHFENLYNNVKYPISLSRGAYWLSRSAAAMNNDEETKKWQTIAGQYSATFYGQMAVLEHSGKITLHIPDFPEFSNLEIRQFISNEQLIEIGLLYAHSDNLSSAADFFLAFINQTDDKDKIAKALTAVSTIGDKVLLNKIAKAASYKNILALQMTYPMMHIDQPLKKQSLIMAIIRQESGFDENAVSSSGAIGFMQLMPATAKDVSNRLKVGYSKHKLKTNPEYNIQLGSYYISHLLNQFDDSYVLSIASYNAGPTNAKRWIVDNGDPRNIKNPHLIIDWIEKIPFAETRNYVQRVLENAIVYLHIIQQDKSVN
jgi:soluble lytic murein transglycosylase